MEIIVGRETGATMFLLLLSALQPTGGLPVMRYSRQGEDHVVEVGDFDPVLGPQIEIEVARRAADLCAGQQVRWGKFKFDEEVGKLPGAGPSQVKSYRREFSCKAADIRTYDPAPADWAATVGDEADVRAIFASYYGKRDGGDFAGSRAMMRPEVQGDLAEWSEQMGAFNRELGKGSRRLTKVSWYVNPETADRPGVYAALDFVGDYPSAHLYCGYIILYRLGAGEYEIVREEQNRFIRNDEAPDPEQLAMIRTASCRE